MSKQDILDYVMRTPYNTNPSVLESLLDSMTEKAPALAPKDFNFFDYDGTLLYSYTKAEVRELDELPPLPQQPGLVCQGWTYLLEELKGSDSPINVGATYITDDDTTRIYIRLNEGRTSPRLGVGVAGSVVVDWGDGTEPDVLTGTDAATVKWTPNHEYSKPGDYIIKLAVDGKLRIMGDSSGSYLLHHTTGNEGNIPYLSAIKKIELGTVSIDDSAFNRLYGLSLITIPRDSILMPNGTSTFGQCYQLKAAILPRGWPTLCNTMFLQCASLEIVTLPAYITEINYKLFTQCHALSSVTLPSTVTTIAQMAFSGCTTLSFIDVPSGVTTINDGVFGCSSATYARFRGPLTLISPNGVIVDGAIFVDFSACTAVPTLPKTTSFFVPSDCEIRVPKNLRDEWAAAYNWTGFANQIVGV